MNATARAGASVTHSYVVDTAHALELSYDDFARTYMMRNQPVVIQVPFSPGHAIVQRIHLLLTSQHTNGDHQCTAGGGCFLEGHTGLEACRWNRQLAGVGLHVCSGARHSFHSDSVRIPLGSLESPCADGVHCCWARFS